MMNWKRTWIMLGSAGALFAFIFLVERHIPGTGAARPPAARLLNIKPAEITSFQLRRTNQFVFKAERTNENWNLVSPILYPAQANAINRLLDLLAGMSSYNRISIKELAEQKRTIAEFGLDVPAATVVLGGTGKRIEVLFGSRNSVGDRVYLQLLNSPDIYVVGTEAYDLLPLNSTDWRDLALVNVAGLNADRIELRSALRSYSIQVNPTSGQFLLTKPTIARADHAKVEALLRTVESQPVAKFISDDPQVELDQFGLQPPEAELVFGQATNDLLTVQFGKATSNEMVFARRMLNTNIVLVPKSLLETLLVSPSDLRDRRLLSFAPEQIDAIEVETMHDKFSVERQGPDSWIVPGPPQLAADPGLVRDCLNRLATLEAASVEKDVVTDFALYGLAPASRHYVLKSSYTNAAGVLTNRIVSLLALSPIQNEKVFARAAEDSVYSLDLRGIDILPTAAWQLRDRRVWSFTTNQIAGITIRDQGYERRIERRGNGNWSLTKGQGVIDTVRIEETMFRLGNLKAAAWVEKSDANRMLYGFSEKGYKLGIELRNGEKPQILSLEFGGLAPSQFPYAIASVDGQNMIFEFPLDLFYFIAKALNNPALRTAAASN